MEWRGNEGMSRSAVFQCLVLHVFYKNNIPVNKYWWLTNERHEYQTAISVIRLCRNGLYIYVAIANWPTQYKSKCRHENRLFVWVSLFASFAPVQWCFLSAMAAQAPVKRLLFISLFALTTKESSKPRIYVYSLSWNILNIEPCIGKCSPCYHVSMV